MRLDRTATLVYERLGRHIQSSGRGRSTPVLMYHNVSEANDTATRPYYRLSTSPARFQEHMRLLADNDYTTASLAAALDSPADRRVVITFDDGYLDFMTSAWPTLERLHFTASVFLPTAFIGDSRRRFKGRECLTWAEVRDLSRAGVSFGSHTVTHPVLHSLPWPALCSELSESRQQIESTIGGPVTTFAYPYAYPQHDSRFVSAFCREIKAHGYERGVTTAIGRFGEGDDPLQIKRLPVNDADDLELFAAKLAGAYDWVGTLQLAWKRLRQPASRSQSRVRTGVGEATNEPG
jgi:peptidoglycan/xylan/chitin deacetylase (PgdA/CDA1 family)